MSDEVLIEEIRTAMRAEVEGIETPRQVLARALDSPPQARLNLGWLMPALAVGVAVAVAVVAVTSLAHRQVPRPNATSSPVPRAARRLVSRLAVLRRTQQPADVLPGWAVRETESLTQGASVIAGLSRLVGSVNLGPYGRARVYLVVQRPPHRRHPGAPLPAPHPGTPLSSPRLGDQATIAFVGPFREEAAINGPTVAAGGEQVAADRYGLVANPGEFTNLWGAVASIVPDGVWRVKWVFQTTAGHARRITVWPHVHANVAIGKLPSRLQIFMRSAVWYGAHGQVIASFGTSGGASLRAQNFKQALEASLRQQIDPALLRHFAVLGIRTAGAPGLDQAAAAPLIEPNPLGLNLAGERFVGAAGPVKVFVIPGRKGMALRCVGPVVGAAQTGSNGALDGQLFLETARVAGHRTIIGLAPNGNRTVRILLGGGGSRTAPVIDNVYSLVVPASARTLIVKNSQGGTRRLRLA